MKRYPKSSFSGIAIDYARRVLNGKQPACIQVKQAAQRFIDDFERTDIRFAEDRVDSVCDFVENLVHVKAEWAGTPIKLEPFQVFLLANIFGWLDVATGYRRFRQAFILLPRKNGKSLLAAAIALYMIFMTGEQGAEGYSGATSLDQANEVFGPAKKMVEMTPGLAEALDIETAARSIYSPSSGSSFRPVIAKTKDGSSPYLAICDELHQAIDDTQINAFRTGMGSRREPLLLIISTAGENTAGVCRTEQLNAEAVLAGRKKNDRLFALIYTIDSDDDWRHVASWKKANPNWGVSVNAEYLRDQLADARQSPAKQAAMRTKHLNEWVAGAHGWLSPLLWSSAADRALRLEDFHGRKAFVACDLSTKQDLTAVALVIPDGARTVVFPFPFVPAGALTESSNAPAYREWIEGGHLRDTPGTASSFDEVATLLADLHRDFLIDKVIFDPWQGEMMRQTVAGWGLATEIWPAYAPSLWTSTLDDFEADLKNGKIAHPGNAVMDWCAGNVAIHSKGGVSRTPVKPGDKERKIDVMIAALMAYAPSNAIAPPPVVPSLMFI